MKKEDEVTKEMKKLLKTLDKLLISLEEYFARKNKRQKEMEKNLKKMGITRRAVS